MKQEKGGNFPPQAFIFRTVFNRSLEIVIVLLLGILIGLNDIFTLVTVFLHGVAGPLIFSFFRKKEEVLSWFLQNLPYGLVLYLVLPLTFPSILGVLLSVGLGALLYFRPRLPAFSLVVGMAVLAWPLLFQQVEAPLFRYYQKVNEGVVGDSIGLAGIEPGSDDKAITDRINNILILAGANMPVGYVDALKGADSVIPADRGWILLIFGFFYLWARGHLTWIAVSGFTIVFFPLYLILAGIPMGKSFWESDALFLLFNGSFMVPLLWNLSDYRQLPLGKWARFVLGLFAGLLCFLGCLVNAYTAVLGTSLLLWLTQRLFERVAVDEIYHKNDSLLLLLKRNHL